MADVFHGACAACHLPFMFGDLVPPVEEVRNDQRP